jgi:hypothetical protein
MTSSGGSDSPERVAGENGPWKMNLDFTIRGATLADAERKAQRINNAAARVGCGPGFTDDWGPDVA